MPNLANDLTETLARALESQDAHFAHTNGMQGYVEWDNLDEPAREQWRTDARTVGATMLTFLHDHGYGVFAPMGQPSVAELVDLLAVAPGAHQ